MAVLVAVLVLLLLAAPEVLLAIFAGLLLAVFFSAGGEPLGRRLGIGRGWGIGLFILLVVLALAGAFLTFAPAAIDQVDQLTQEIPEAVDSLRAASRSMPAASGCSARSRPDASYRTAAETSPRPPSGRPSARSAALS